VLPSLLQGISLARQQVNVAMRVEHFRLISNANTFFSREQTRLSILLHKCKWMKLDKSFSISLFQNDVWIALEERVIHEWTRLFQSVFIRCIRSSCDSVLNNVDQVFNDSSVSHFEGTTMYFRLVHPTKIVDSSIRIIFYRQALSVTWTNDLGELLWPTHCSTQDRTDRWYW
jgi:hypothetical protein